MNKLPRLFYERDTATVAKELLGKYLIHDSDSIERIGKIVEVEAYLGQHDLTSDNFYIAEKENQAELILLEKPRIGVHYAKDWAEKLLRFYIQGNPYISRR